MNIELGHLKYFYEVAKHGSFTKAARALRISQPGISKAVQTLESQQGVKLFDRGRTSVRLTPDGELFLRRCQAIFAEIESLENDIASREGECAGPLAIGASDNLCHCVLPKLLTRFCESHVCVLPKIFAGVSDAIIREVEEGRSEVGLFYTEPKSVLLDAQRVGEVEFVLVVSPKLLKKRTPAIKDIEQLLYAGSRIEDYAKPYPALKKLLEQGLKPRIGLETNSQETQKRFALAGFGYTVVPRFMVEGKLRSGDLVAVATRGKMTVPLWLVVRKNRTLSAPSREFIRVARKELRAI